MPTLLILRHAKSSWKDAGLDDHDRPLNKRGKRDAPRMGQLILDEELVPQRILCSTALRAQETARRAAQAWDGEETIELDSRLYHAGVARWIDVIGDEGAGADPLLVIGHNPGLEELLEALTGEPEILPTAALAQIELAIDDWTQLRPHGEGQLVSIWRPRELS